MGAATQGWLAGALLLAAGAFQFTSLKQTCLRKCRTPRDFPMLEGRDSAAGAAFVGLRHGAFCVGCCWALMLLPLVAGTVNIAWMALITAIVVAENTVPVGGRRARAIGAGLLLLGAAMLVLGVR